MGQTSNLAINPTLYKDIPYDPIKDLVPVGARGEGPIAIAVRTESPLKTLADLVAAAKAKPGAISMASPGSGTVAHLSGVRLMQAANIKMEHIPYKGASARSGSPRRQRGHLHVVGAERAGAGRLRAACASSPSPPSAARRSSRTCRRSARALQGLRRGDVVRHPRAGETPAPIVAKLNAEINKALQQPELKKRLGDEGADPLGGTPEQFAQLIRDDIGRWGKIVKESGVRLD